MLLSVSLLLASTSNAQDQPTQMRIVALSPHLTEIVFALGKGDNIVGVSDYSDYPQDAKLLPSVASFEGANIAQIIRLKPTIVLVWRGGNKDADIEKLGSLGLNVFESKIDSVDDLLINISEIGAALNAQSEAETLVSDLTQIINGITHQYKNKRQTAIYYLSTQPLIGLGNDPWLNSLLDMCQIKNMYKSSISAYPQLQMPDIIRKQPSVLIGANKNTINNMKQFWLPHINVLDSHLVKANPDALHRFTPRAIIEMVEVCQAVYE